MEIDRIKKGARSPHSLFQLIIVQLTDVILVTGSVIRVAGGVTDNTFTRFMLLGDLHPNFFQPETETYGPEAYGGEGRHEEYLYDGVRRHFLITSDSLIAQRERGCQKKNGV